MSGIYIPGMEMPTEGFVEILIRDDGTVLQTGQSYRADGADYYTPYIGEKPVIYKAIPVPDHGRLIDIDAPYQIEVHVNGRTKKGGVDIYAPIVLGTDPVDKEVEG